MFSEYVQGGEGNVTAIACNDETSKVIAARAARAKGIVELVKRTLEFVIVLSHAKILIQSDVEGAVGNPRGEVIVQRKASTIPVGSVPYHPQTRGVAGKDAHDSTIQLRTFKIGSESIVKAHVLVEVQVVELMVEHVGVLIGRHLVGHGGKAVYERISDRTPLCDSNRIRMARNGNGPL